MIRRLIIAVTVAAVALLVWLIAAPVTRLERGVQRASPAISRPLTGVHVIVRRRPTKARTARPNHAHARGSSATTGAIDTTVRHRYVVTPLGTAIRDKPSTVRTTRPHRGHVRSVAARAPVAPLTAPARVAQPAAAPVDRSQPSGTIVIPHLGVNVPIFERGIDAARQLPIAPGLSVTHYLFSAAMGQPGNYVVYGHDDIDGQVFRYLPTMRVGDLVYLSSGRHRYVYRVSGSQIVSPSDVAVMAPTKAATLTMISCTPYWVDTQRIVVTAQLV